MKHFVSSIAVFITFLGLTHATEEEWRYQWRDQSLKQIESLQEDSPGEHFKRIGRLAALKGRDAKVSLLSGEVADAAIDKLLSVSVHASVFENELRKLDELERSYHEDKIPELSNSGYHRAMLFKTLEHLPSHQIVELLGELLDDPSQPWHTRKREAGVPPYPSNAIFAARTLGNLPIADPPVSGTPRNPRETLENVEQWKIWRDQIRNGIRTFRFEGDPKTYNFDGVVRNAAAAAPATRRSDPPATAPAESPEPKQRWWPAMLAILVLVGGMFQLLRLRRNA